MPSSKPGSSRNSSGSSISGSSLKQRRNKYGNPLKYDPTFTGPVAKRSCTDLVFALIFALLLMTYFVIGLWAFAKGSPDELLYPSDSNGNLCGVKQFKGKPYLMFFDLMVCANSVISSAIHGCNTPQVCVSQCPDRYWGIDFQQLTPVELDQFRGQIICKYNVNIMDPSTDVGKALANGDCAYYYMKSSPVVGRCVPEFIQDGVNQLAAMNVTVESANIEQGSVYLKGLLNLEDYGQKAMQDVRATWWMIIIALIIAMVLSGAYLLIMAVIAGPLVWFTVVLFLGGLGVIAGYSFYRYYRLRKYPTDSLSSFFTDGLSYYTNLTTTWLAVGIISAVFFLIILAVVVFLRKRIRISVEMIRLTSRATARMLSVLFFPIITWILLILFFLYWLASMFYLASIGDNLYWSNVTADNGTTKYQDTVNDLLSRIPCNTHGNSTGADVCSFIKYGGRQYTIYLEVFLFLMLLWGLGFISALGQMTLAGPFAYYYWARSKKEDIPRFPVSLSAYRVVRYHLGTVAFGSLIISVVTILRALIEVIESKVSNKNSGVAKTIFKCCRCCFWCVQKFLKFINKNAYIETAIYGTNFCRSTARAFKLIMRNLVDNVTNIVILDRVTDFIVFLGKMLVTLAVVGLSWYFFSGQAYRDMPIDSISEYMKNYTPQLNYFFLPVIISAIGAYAVATAFFNVWVMGVDTTYLCFLEDLERNKGRNEYYMSKELAKIMKVQTVQNTNNEHQHHDQE